MDSTSSGSTYGSSLDTEEWLKRVRVDHGESLAVRLAALSSSLGSQPSPIAWHGWTELMVRLPQEVERGSKPHLPAHKLRALRRLANSHLEAMKHSHERVESVAAAASSNAWDRRLLESDFYPADDDHDDDGTARRFDPWGWLCQLLAEREWRNFGESLHRELTDAEILELVSWGQAIPDSAFGKYLVASF